MPLEMKIFFFVLIALNLVLRRSHFAGACAGRVFGKYGSVRVDIDATYHRPLDQRWGSTWPDGIKLANNIQVSFPRAIKFHNTTGYPYTESREISTPPTTRRTYLWKADELIVSCNMTTNLAFYPTCSRLIPSLKWLTASGAKVSPVSLNSAGSATTTTNSDVNANNIVEIRIGKNLVESNLAELRGNGFSREDIFRMLDKGPWILACDVSRPMQSLFSDLRKGLGIEQSQCVHIISHCPYLLAQYVRYRGRDVGATIKALLELGYKQQSLVNDVVRFPSMLSASPERLYGWLNFLQRYNVANSGNQADFVKMLTRAPFMFYLDPPYLMDWSEDTSGMGAAITSQSLSTANDLDPNSPIVSYEPVQVLELLDGLQLPAGQLDKLVRTQPMILLSSKREISLRINFLISLLSDYHDTKLSFTHDSNPSEEVKPLLSAFGQEDRRGEVFIHSKDIFGLRVDDTYVHSNQASSENDHAKKMLHELLMSYPKVLSIPFSQLKSISNALRAGGFKRIEIIHLLKKHPYAFQKSPEIIQNLLIFLKNYCGLRKIDIVPFLFKNPSILKVDIDTLQPKIDYLFYSLGGTSATLRRYPLYLSYNLEEHIRPRAEFLRAFQVNPIMHDLEFLLTAPPAELASVAGVAPDSFAKFCALFNKKWTSSSPSS